MIETLMALWNRGMGGRLLVMIVTFFCLCISISLLFVTVGSVWGSLLAHGRPPGEATAVTNATLITATAPPSVTTAPVVVTPTIPPGLCLASPTEAHGNTARTVASRKHEKNGVPTRTATSGPLHKTPTPGATTLPTLPAVTPTVPLTPTITTQPTVTPIATNTPANTPTITLTPTDTSTPGATPTPTPTLGLAPTGTDTPTVTVAGTATPVTTPTVPGTPPSDSPTVIASATGRQVHDGRPQIPGTPVDANNSQPGQGNCLGDSLVTDGEANVLSRLQGFFWIILLSSLLGTTLFCTRVYRLARKARR